MTEPRPRTWPVLSGTVPALAEGYMRRPETGQRLGDELHAGMTVILGPQDDPGAPPTHQGGTGKTQLAAAFARGLWAAASLDLLVWVNAGSRDRIIASYARALEHIRVAAPAGQPEAAAVQFLAWLSETRRRWLVVLDGLAEADDAEGLWPHGPAGQTLVTSRLAGLTPSIATPAQGGPAPQILPIALSAFSQREALAYVSERLNDDPYHAAGALDLAATLGCLPLGLDLAVAYLLESGQDCRRYRLAYEGYRDWATGSSPLAPAWMLAVDRARELARAELPWPALKLAAVLGQDWIPGSVLTSAAACTYITGRQAVTTGDQAGVRAAFGELERVGLVTVDPDDDVRTVRVPAGLRLSVQFVMGAPELRRTVRAAADAICESWPSPAEASRSGSSWPDLDQALRDCGTSLTRCDEVALWDPDCHPVLLQAGQSLEAAGMAATALGYWRHLASRSAAQHGARAPFTLSLRERLASAAAAAGHGDEVIRFREELAADIDRVAGSGSPQAITARLNLAAALRTAGRFSDAISQSVRVVEDCDSVFGAAHAQTKESLRELGRAYSAAGDYRDAIDVLRRCLALHAETLGVTHPETVATRGQLAQTYRLAGRGNEAIRLYQEALAQVEQAAGAGHRSAVTAREGLAIAFYQAGRPGEAATTFERVLADWRRVPGAGPGTTVAARGGLAAIYCAVGRGKDAIPLYAGVVADCEQLRGTGHQDTLRARRNLAAAYHHARRLPEAVELGEETLADCERVLGAGDRETLTVRANLAHAYHATGRLKRASAQFDRALRDCERALGPEDPLTSSVQDLRKRYLAGRQGSAPIVAAPDALFAAHGAEGLQSRQVTDRIAGAASTTALLSTQYPAAKASIRPGPNTPATEPMTAYPTAPRA